MITTQQKSRASQQSGGEKLALHGGPRAITARGRETWRNTRWRDLIPLAKHMYYDSTTNSDGQGVIKEFEEEFARLCSCKYGLAMNSGTAALHSALFAVGVGPGNEVILPSYTYHASATPVLCCGAKPVFCDINPETLTVDPVDMERRITSQTKAILVVHVWGNPAEMDKIRQLADARGLPIIEDCSHAHGASFAGKPVGAWGDVGCFSLQGQKAVSAGEGGIAVCNNPLFFDRMLGLGHPIRVSNGRKGTEFDIGSMNIGPKYRPHLFGVILANESLKRLPQLNALRRHNWDILRHELAHCEGVRPVGTLPSTQRGGFLEFKFVLQPTLANIDRKEFLKALEAEGAPCSADRYGFLHDSDLFCEGGPVTNATLTRRISDSEQHTLPNTESLRERVFTLPAFTSVKEPYVRQCARAINKVADYFKSRAGEL